MSGSTIAKSMEVSAPAALHVSHPTRARCLLSNAVAIRINSAYDPSAAATENKTNQGVYLSRTKHPSHQFLCFISVGALMGQRAGCSSPHSFLFAIIVGTMLLSAPVNATSSTCAEFSSSYSHYLRAMQLPASVVQAAAVYANIECQRSPDAPQYMTRCYSMIYRWCSGGGTGDINASQCGADWRLVAGLHRIDSLHTLLQHARLLQHRELLTNGSSRPRRALIYRPSARGEGWGNRVMALTAAYAAALLSRRTFHMVFDRDDAIMSSIDFRKFPPFTLLSTSIAQRDFPCLSFAATIEDPPLNFVHPNKRRRGPSVSWLRSHVVSGLDDHVAWLGRLDGSSVKNARCAGDSVLYVSGAAAIHHTRDSALRFSDRDHGGIWGSASIVVYSSYDSFWGALLERPATGMFLKRLLLPLTVKGAADVSWAPHRAHLRAWLAFGAFASAVIAPSEPVARIKLSGLASLSVGSGQTPPHCSRMQCAQCLGVAVRRGRPWNGDWAVVDDAGEARMLACARSWTSNATGDSAGSAVEHGSCAFVSADDPEVLQRWVTTLTQDGASVAYTPGSDGSHTGTQHAARTGSPPSRAVHRSYKDWFTLACCSRDALLTDNSSFGYSAIALAVQRWLRDETAALHEVMPLMQQPPPAQPCARMLWKGHMCPAPSSLNSEKMIPC